MTPFCGRIEAAMLATLLDNCLLLLAPGMAVAGLNLEVDDVVPKKLARIP